MREPASHVTRFLTRAPSLRAARGRTLRLPALLAAAGLALAACGQTSAPTGQRIGGAGPTPTPAMGDNSFDPSGPVQVALLIPTGAADEGARKAAEGVEAGARLILGPLRGDGALAAGPVAAEAGVNLISFSNSSSAAGNNVWLLGLLPSVDADRIVGYASARGYGSLGVFYAETPYGETAFSAISDAARRHGAYVAAAGSYPRSFEGIQGASEGFAAQAEASGVNAVLLPSEGSELQAAASFLNFHGLLSSNVKYLGLSRWNNQTTRKEPTLVGAWFAAPDPARVEEFAARYANAYGHPPGSLDGLGYDAVAAAGALLKEARARGDRNAFSAAAITDPSGFVGVDGVFRFTPDGLNQRGLAVLEVQPDEFTVIDPAPQRFDVVY